MGGDHAPTGPYYPEVVGLAQELLKGRVFNLDELLLDGRLPAGNTKSFAVEQDISPLLRPIPCVGNHRN
jgi:hypothetical protein